MKYHSVTQQLSRNEAHKTLIAGKSSRYFFTALFIFLASIAKGQQVDTSKLLSSIKDNTNSGAPALSIKQCIDYALIHQPALNQSQINIEITKATNAINLSTWLPQITASGDAVHYIQQSEYSTTTTNTGSSSSSTRSSTVNSFIPQLSVSQTIFNPSLLFAARSAPLLVKQSQQSVDSTKIYLVDAVSKSYYNVLLTLEQINVYREDTARLGRSMRDAYHQYKGGIVDETDYEEAAISQNNAIATLKTAVENVVPQYATLKQLMGYPPEQQFNVVFDTLQMMNDIQLDTTEQLNYEKRIEYQQIHTQQAIQNEQIHYYQWAWLPTASAFYNYNLAFESNNLNTLFSTSYPTQLIGVSFSIPIFTGFSRVNSEKRAKLQLEQLKWSETNLKSQIYTEYTTALAGYKSNFFNLTLLQKNVQMARRTYFVVDLQYRQGIVPYLNVITAQSNLIQSEISYINAVFQTLSSKIDLKKAMGDITY
jgi:outer membrane protein TolC